MGHRLIFQPNSRLKKVEMRKPATRSSQWSVTGYSEERRSDSIVFPMRCVVCSKQLAGFEEFTYLGNSCEINISLPFCAEHLAIVQGGGEHYKTCAPKSRLSGALKKVSKIGLVIFIFSLMALILSTIKQVEWGIDLSNSEKPILITAFLSFLCYVAFSVASKWNDRIAIQNWVQMTAVGRAEKERCELYNSVIGKFGVKPKAESILLFFADTEFAEALRTLNQDKIIN